MTEDEWYEKYKPIKNHLDPNASWNGEMFETYGEEIQFVNSQPDENVWTWIDGENRGTYLTSGQSYVNRLGYLICSVPWTDGYQCIVIDEEEDLCDECGENFKEDCECELEVEL